MADNVTVNVNANVEAIVADYQKNLPATKLHNLVGGAAESIFGKELGKVATFMPDLISSVLGKIFKLKSAWSRLKAKEKEDLIDSLAQEAVFLKGLVDLGTAKTYVENQLIANNIIPKEDKGKFFNNNTWAQNHVQMQLNDYNAKLALANRIIDTTKEVVINYNRSKVNLIAVNAILKLKKGVSITSDEQSAVKQYLELKNSVAISQSVRNSLRG